jgi:ABC-type amino acid transport substrate-binding protein
MRQLNVVMLMMILFIGKGVAITDETSNGTKIVTIGVEAMDYCPILCFGENKTTGFLVELLDKLQQNTGIEYELMPYAIPRLKKEIKSGNIDVKFPDNPAWSRGEGKQFSGPIIPFRDAFFSLKSDTEHNLSDINSAAVPSGFYVPKSIRKNIQIIEASSIGSMFDMLKHGRVEAVYLNQLVAQNQAKRAGIAIIERKDYPSDNNYFHFSGINDKGFIERINGFLNADPKVLKELLDKYGLE